MTTRKLLFLLSVVLYVVCFYDQRNGMNYLLFTPWLFITQIALFPEVLRKSIWWISLVAAMISAFGVWYTNSSFAVVFHLGLLSFSALNILDKRSVFVQLINSIFNWIWNVPGMIIDYFERKKDSNNQITTYLLLSIIPFLITVIFIALYASANPVFEWLVNKIDLSWIRFTLILSFIVGFFLMYLFFFPKRNNVFNIIELSMPDSMQPEAYEKNNFSRNENLSGIILLSMLNIVLLLFNLTDLITYFATSTLPKGMTYAGLLHQGVGTMIFSIVLAIGILLYFFRGSQNYNPNKTLLYLALIWVIQNILMVLMIFWKNGLYIQEYGLTYKRIGVYIWLGLTVGGLITTLIKITYQKSLFYLIKSNVAITFFTLSIVLSCNWDRTIAWYNLNHCRQKNPDLAYLLSLSSSTYPELSDYIQQHDLPIPSKLYNNLKYRHQEQQEDSFFASNQERKRIAQAWEKLEDYYENKNKQTVSIYEHPQR